MKSLCLGGIVLSVVCPVLAGQGEDRAPVGLSDTPVQVLSIATENDEARHPANLRDLLRQPFDDMEASDSKPYRLSVEERHRLREQLRSQRAHGSFQGRP